MPISLVRSCVSVSALGLALAVAAPAQAQSREVKTPNVTTADAPASVTLNGGVFVNKGLLDAGRLSASATSGARPPASAARSRRRSGRYVRRSVQAIRSRTRMAIAAPSSASPRPSTMGTVTLPLAETERDTAFAELRVSMHQGPTSGWFSGRGRRGRGRGDDDAQVSIGASYTF